MVLDYFSLFTLETLLIDLGHGDILVGDLLATLSGEDSLSVLIEMKLGDNHVGGVNANRNSLTYDTS
jgi:hypothetical protein